jgi:predicted aconitase with swiveling domain
VNKSFKGSPVLAGNLIGEALVTHMGFNSLASFYKAMLTGAKKAICSDQDNPELFGKDLKDKIICLPKTVGSTSAGTTWDKVAQMGIAPKAMLFSQKIDSLAAGGLIIADIWARKRIVAVDQLGSELLDCVKDGDRILVREDGSVTIIKD